MANCMKNILKVTGLLAGVTLGVWASTKLTADVKVRDIKPTLKSVLLMSLRIEAVWALDRNTHA